MACYTIGDVKTIISYDEFVVLEEIATMVAHKLGLTGPRYVIACGVKIDHEWLKPVIDEIDRWCLNDFDPNVNIMIIPKNDVDDFKVLSKLVEEIIKQNYRLRKKFVTHAQAEQLVNTWSHFLSEFNIDDQKLISHNGDREMTKKQLFEIVNNIKNGIKKGLEISFRE